MELAQQPAQPQQLKKQRKAKREPVHEIWNAQQKTNTSAPNSHVEIVVRTTQESAAREP